ncbi:Zn-ribbon domain-containing OB-fold protein [Amycolatopsis sp. GM8]|uniref:Zn-ribbon domain-containing OB-fold protein n=1 Tax=Amycolatopsis sp. GM8 TaxID=2896530 RepID=UPI001F2824C3|nr:OB-fold domain-containing protein [Amycolatopsis sp. GM8]
MTQTVDKRTVPEAFRYPPQPVPDADTKPFWEAAAKDELTVCRCQSCGLWMQPPLERCRACDGTTAFERVAGTGVIYTFIVQRQAAVAGYLDKTPYVVALVDLDEQTGLRLPGRVVGIAPEEVSCGMRVEARFTELAGGDFRVPVFSPAAS